MAGTGHLLCISSHSLPLLPSPVDVIIPCIAYVYAATHLEEPERLATLFFDSSLNWANLVRVRAGVSRTGTLWHQNCQSAQRP